MRDLSVSIRMKPSIRDLSYETFFQLLKEAGNCPLYQTEHEIWHGFQYILMRRKGGIQKMIARESPSGVAAAWGAKLFHQLRCTLPSRTFSIMHNSYFHVSLADWSDNKLTHHFSYRYSFAVMLAIDDWQCVNSIQTHEPVDVRKTMTKRWLQCNGGILPRKQFARLDTALTARHFVLPGTGLGPPPVNSTSTSIAPLPPPPLSLWIHVPRR